MAWKKMSVVVSALACAGVLSAGDASMQAPGAHKTGPFLGVTIGGAIAKTDTFTKGANHVGNAFTYGLRLGAQDEEWRALLGYERYKSDSDDQELNHFFLNVDYYFLSGYGDWATGNIRPYIGASLGYADYETSVLGHANSVTYGGQIGAVMELTQEIDVDLELHYNFSARSEIDHIGGVRLGINYTY